MILVNIISSIICSTSPQQSQLHCVASGNIHGKKAIRNPNKVGFEQPNFKNKNVKLN